MEGRSSRKADSSSSGGSRRQKWLCLLVLVAACCCLSICSATDTQAAPCQGDACPYILDDIPDLPTLLKRHKQYQTAVLAGASASSKVTVQAVLVQSNDLVGLGNRLPAVVTGFVLALLTQRIFFLHSTFQSIMELPFPGNWADYMDKVAALNCAMSWKRFTDPQLGLCDDLFFEAHGHRKGDVLRYTSPDYDAPLLQINPTLAPLFAKFFPDGEVASRVLPYLLNPLPALEAAMGPYMADAQQCLVGMHIRTRKYGGVRVRQFTSITRMLAQGKEGGVFVASDASLFSHVQKALPGRHVWWSDATATALVSATRTKGANPGTELSAIVDMFLLSKCKHIILTPASSLGAVAAALGGVQPVYANFGKHADPFLNPWFWQSVTTEPCFFKAAGMHLSTDEVSSAFRDRHPLYLYHNQCHYQQHLRAVPQYLKLHTNDTSYITTMLSR